MKLEDTMLSEIINYKKTNALEFHIYKVLRAIKIMQPENRIMAARDYGVDRLGIYCSMDIEILF